MHQGGHVPKEDIWNKNEKRQGFVHGKQETTKSKWCSTVHPTDQIYYYGNTEKAFERITGFPDVTLTMLEN